MKKMKGFLLFAVVISAFFALFVFNAAAEDEDFAMKVKNTAEGIEVIWTEDEGAYYYELYRQCNDGSEEVLLSTGEDADFTDTEVTDGLIYGYRVCVIDTDEKTSYESALSIIYRMGATRIENYYSSDTGLYIEWNALAEAKGYYVMRSEYNSGKWDAVAKVDAATLNFTDTKADAAERYLYAVIPFAGSYIGPASNQVALSFFACPDILGVVSTEKGIKLKWKEVPSAEYYFVYRRDSINPEWTAYALLDSEYTSYEDKGIKSGVIYAYIVRAADSSGQLSPYDDEARMTHIAKPVIKSAESATNGVKLTWTPSAGCQGYAIYRRDYGMTNWALAGLVKDEATVTFTDSKVYNSRAYTYVVRAVWNKNLSSYDKEGATVRFLEAPQTLICDVDTANGNVLTWKNNPHATVFFVFRKEMSGKWKAIGKTVQNVFADKKADASKVYQYTVMAYTSSTFISGPAAPVSTFGGTLSKDSKMVALTYDDGPSDSITNGILDILESYGAKATFFVLGQNIEYGKEAMARAAKLGCEIGNHTYSHIDLPTSSEEEIREEISYTDALVKKYTGKPTTVARAPGGAFDETVGEIVGKPFYYWTVDTRDWESRDAASVIAEVEYNVSDGDIILMHDIYDSTLEASEYIIPWLISEGYQLVTVSELMYYKSKVNVRPGVQYFDGFGATDYVG